MSERKKIVTAAFNSGAEKFDEIGPPFFSYYGEIIAKAAKIKPGDIILDVACGKGAVTFPVAEELNNDGKVFGIDISENMIKECKKRSIANKTDKPVFMVMDAENLKFENETFDKVLCGFGLFFLPDIEKGLSEIKRVLKKDGTLIFSSWNNEYQLTWLIEILAEYLPDLKNPLKPDHDRIHESDFRTITGIEKILGISGFKKVEILTENIDCYYKNEEEWIKSRWNSGTRMFFERLTENQLNTAMEKIKKSLGNHKDRSQIKITMSAFITKACK